MTEAATVFWRSIIGSVLRHALSGVAGALVTHGYVTQSGVNAYIEELVGAVIYGACQMWSNRVSIANRTKLLVALMIGHPTTENHIDAIIASGAPTPVLSTPPDTIPRVPAVPKVEGK